MKTIYAYRVGETTPVLTMEDVVKYTDDAVWCAEGMQYGPFVDNIEFSLTPDCTGTLRSDYRRDHPSDEERISMLEELLASVLYG